MDQTATDFCVELPQGQGAPEWVELFPPGPEIVGRDGRSYLLEDAAAVAAASLDGKTDLPVDWEHATDVKAPKGEEAPAAGWITKIEARAGAVWGKVEWTDRGRAQVEAREYRYISPHFMYTKSRRVLVKLLSAGLTNTPNFTMTALSREGASMNKKILKALGLAEDATDEQAVTAINTLRTERDSARSKEIRTALGLAEDATDEQAVTAINTLKTERDSAQHPSLDEFVPRADYDLAVASVSRNAKQALDSEIDTAIAKALEAGKITPATEEYHRAQCRLEGGLERFRKYVGVAPEVARNTNLGGTPSGKTAELTGDAKKIASMFGHKAEDLKKYR